MDAHRSRLSLIVNGGFTHPVDGVTPIDIRYGETIDSPHLAHRALQGAHHFAEPLDVGPHPARCVVVWNVEGGNLKTYPDAETAAALARRILLICDADGRPLLELPPASPGKSPPCGQPLWLAEGAQLTLRAKYLDAPTVARVLAFPRKQVSGPAGPGSTTPPPTLS